MPVLFLKFLRWCPGALGLWLRQRFYRNLFGECGRGVIIGRFVDIVEPHLIHLGNHAILSNNAILDASLFRGKGPAIALADQVFIGLATSLIAAENSIEIGRGSNLGSRCKLTSNRPLVIGEDVLLAAYCEIGNPPASLFRDNSKQTPPKSTPAGGSKTGRTFIDNGAWLGVRACLDEGVEIGRGAIIGAHSVVVEDVPPLIIVTGRPARTLRQRTAE